MYHPSIVAGCQSHAAVVRILTQSDNENLVCSGKQAPHHGVQNFVSTDPHLNDNNNNLQHFQL